MSILLSGAVPPASEFDERPYRIAALIAALLILLTTAV